MISQSNILKKLVTLFAVISITTFTAFNLYGQPNWVPATPAVSPGPLSFSCDYGIDMTGTVYIVIFNQNAFGYTSNNIRNYAEAGVGNPAGPIVASVVLPVSAGEINTVLNEIIEVFQPNRTHTVYFTAIDDATSTLQASPVRILTATLACPSIFVATALDNNDKCVNGDGATKIYTLNTYDGFSGTYSNVLKGASWTIDWGDGSGSTNFFTSTYDNDGPGPVVIPGLEIGSINHTYTAHDSCWYEATLTVTNPGACATTSGISENKTSILAGRDWDADGNGEMLLVNDSDSSPDTIKVCEGTEAFITLRDDGTWDCDENFHPYPPGEMNSPDRNVQFVYGMHPQTQAVENTITGDVDITGAFPGTANGAAGHASGIINIPTGAMSPITNPNTTSDLINIPNTTNAGEYMHVYFKNWNKCNPYSGPGNEWDGSAVWDSIVIYIVAAPDAPTIADKEICFVIS